MKLTTARRRVAKGIAFLDERLPGWRRIVDRRRLDLSECDRCIVGQIFDGFDRGRGILGLTASEAERLGFLIRQPADASDDRIAEVYRPLTEAWREVIE